MPNTESIIYKVLPIRELIKSPKHWDREVSEEDLDELAGSVNNVGQLNPIIVRKVGKKYEYLAGERRFLALKKIGAKTVRCSVVLDCDDTMAEIISLEENLKTKKPTSEEWKAGVRRLLEIERGRLRRIDEPTPERRSVGRPKDEDREAEEEVAKKTGVSVRTVQRIDAQSHLIPAAKKALAAGKITEQQADLLAEMKENDQYVELPIMMKESQKETSVRKSAEAMHGSENMRVSRAAMKMFDRLTVACRDTNAIAEAFRKELTDDLVEALADKTDKYKELEALHTVLGHILEDFGSVASWLKRVPHGGRGK